MEKELKVVINLQDNMSSKMPNVTGSIIKAELALGALKASAGLAFSALEKAFSFGKDALDTAVAYEQNSIAFKAMIGDGEQAKNLLKDLSKFARQTPFELPEIQEGAKRLLAYNVSVEKIIPTLTMLGDIASAVGKEKMPQLLLAYGQTRAALKLTGAELRQYSEAGVPLLQALIDKANENGGVLVKMGGISKETATKIKKLGSSIAQASFDLKYFKENGGATETKMRSLENTIKKNEAQIKSFGNAGVEYYGRVKVTAEQMIKRISDGEVSFEETEAALQSLTAEGGKFHDMMLVQSASLGGIFSNISDSITRVHLAFMGLGEDGEIVNQGLFDKIKEGAGAMQGSMEGLTAFITNTVSPSIVGFIEKIQKIATEIYKQVKPSLDELDRAIKNDLMPTIKDLNIDWEALEKMMRENIVVTIKATVEVLKELITWMKDHKKEIQWVIDNGTKYLQFWSSIYQAMFKVAGILKDINDLLNGKNLKKLADKYGFSIISNTLDDARPNRAHGGFTPGSAYDAFPTILHGGERVIPRNGTDVNKGNTSNITVNFNGSIGNTTQQDLNAIVQAVKSAINRENLLYSQGAY